MQTKDIMSPNVITVLPDATVDEIAELLLNNKISAAPVVDTNGKLEGLVSEGDLIRRVAGDKDDGRSWWLRLLSSDEDNAREFIKVRGHMAKDVMTHNVVTVTEDTELSDVVHTLETHHIKRVPVVRDGKVVGLVSRSNLLQVVAGRKTEVKKQATSDDREIRTRVHDTLVKRGFVKHSAERDRRGRRGRALGLGRFPVRARGDDSGRPGRRGRDRGPRSLRQPKALGLEQLTPPSRR